MATGQFLAGFEQLLLLIKQVLVMYHERRHPAGPNIWYAPPGAQDTGLFREGQPACYILFTFSERRNP